MLKCKSCGASNDANSSVCAKCGASLKKRIKKRPITEYKDIYSNTDPSKSIEGGSESMDVFSSGEMFEKAKKDHVLDKIYKQELALGEVPHIPGEDDNKPEPEVEKVQPTVINRETTSDIVGIHKTNKKKRNRGQTGKIPQRVIESSRPQSNGGKSADVKKPAKNANPSSRETVKQKQKMQAVKTPVMTEEVYSEDLRKKSKPVDEELVPLTPVSRSYKKNTSNAALHTEKLKDADFLGTPVSEKTETKVKTEQKPTVKKHDKPEKIKKSQSAPVSERPLQKTVTSDGRTNAVKSEKSPVKQEKAVQTQNKESSKPAKKKADINKASEQKMVKKTEKPAEKAKQAEKTAEILMPKPVSEKPAPKIQIEKVETKPVEEKKPTVEQTNKQLEQKTEVVSTKTAAAEASVTAAAVKSSKQQKVEVKTKPSEKVTEKKSVQQKQKKKFFSDEDVAENSIKAALSYFGILFLIPYFKRKQSKLCRAHSKQGIFVFVYSLMVELLTLLLVLGLRALAVWVLGLPYALYTALFIVVLAGMAALLIIPVFVGAKSAFNGIYKTVPIVGKYVKKMSKNKKQNAASKKKKVSE